MLSLRPLHTLNPRHRLRQRIPAASATHPARKAEAPYAEAPTHKPAAAESVVRMRHADYFAGVIHRARDAGFAGEDWAVGQYRIAQSDAPLRTKKD